MIFVPEMHGFEVRCWAHHCATTSCLGHTQNATIRINTVIGILWYSCYKQAKLKNTGLPRLHQHTITTTHIEAWNFYATDSSMKICSLPTCQFNHFSLLVLGTHINQPLSWRYAKEYVVQKMVGNTGNTVVWAPLTHLFHWLRHEIPCQL